ncbi:MAG: hypothetical protein H0X17_07095 [Deltaproteobacteria bacterium]|nr:hypothetical protein [Deltaproteobacteria bacterium]
MKMRVTTPSWGRAAARAVALVCALGVPAAAQPKQPAPPDKPAKGDGAPPAGGPTKKGPVKEQNFNFDGLGLAGRTRSPQLLYFLERANEELERASLEKRSFIPHLVRTVEDEAL